MKSEKVKFTLVRHSFFSVYCQLTNLAVVRQWLRNREEKSHQRILKQHLVYLKYLRGGICLQYFCLPQLFYLVLEANK